MARGGASGGFWDELLADDEGACFLSVLRALVPDDAVAPSRDWLPEEFDKEVTSQYPEPRPGSLQERYNQILGKMAKTRPAASIGDDFQTLQDALEERYNER